MIYLQLIHAAKQARRSILIISFFLCINVQPADPYRVVHHAKDVNIDDSWNIYGNYKYLFEVLTVNGFRNISLFIETIENNADLELTYNGRLVNNLHNFNEQNLKNKLELSPINIGVDFQTSVKFTNFEKFFADYLDLSLQYPADHISYSLQFPEKMDFKYRIRHEGYKFEEIVTRDYFAWDASEVYDVKLMISTVNNWDDVSRHYTYLYSSQYSGLNAYDILLSGKEVSALGIHEKISLVINYLAENIEYRPATCGDRQMVPYHSNLVIERGYGDCKDVALLGTELLISLGVEAYVVLTGKTSTEWAYQLPDPFIFNHAQIAASIDGRIFLYDVFDEDSYGKEICQQQNILILGKK
ncbi:transglutaminase-like domain-containing protein [Desulfonatronovibrio magnus]|uniref:transglutaminase-like domain-containing protein n=1 Tax=Desulfonatronovibrio magnus TaxID=698827 RepID=UPI0005EBAD0F|nr:transglutaminase-like domain-containing protein [Desulfonatronovibrio magnus]